MTQTQFRSRLGGCRTPIRRRRGFRPGLEQLEDRCVPSGMVRSYDGAGNNLLHPDWGSVGVQLLRAAPAQYADGISTPAGADLPSANWRTPSWSASSAA